METDKECYNMSVLKPTSKERQMGSFNDSMRFIDTYRTNHDNIKSVTSGWHKTFVSVCRGLGINRHSANVLFRGMCDGNWEHLHQTQDEQVKTSEDWFADLIGDVFYCSDRWSIDRLMRCHWYFRQWLMSCVGYVKSYDVVGSVLEK